MHNFKIIVDFLQNQLLIIYYLILLTMTEELFLNINLIHLILFMIDMVIWYLVMGMFAKKYSVNIGAKIKMTALALAIIIAFIAFSIVSALIKGDLGDILSLFAYLASLAYSMRYSLEFFWKVEPKPAEKIASNTSIVLIVVTIISNLALAAIFINAMF